MKLRAVPVCVLTLAIPAAPIIAQQPRQESPEKVYLHQTYGPKAIVEEAFGAGINHARNVPHEWGGGIQGFGKRFGAIMGSHIIKKTVQYPIAKFRHESMRYERSNDTGFGPRMRHALVATVYAPRTDREGQTVALGHVSGAVAAGFLSRLWQPARLHTVASGVATSGLILASDAGMNVLKEFWPEIRHPKSHMQDDAKPVPVAAPARK